MNMKLENRICPAGLGRETIRTANLPPELQGYVIKIRAGARVQRGKVVKCRRLQSGEW